MGGAVEEGVVSGILSLVPQVFFEVHWLVVIPTLFFIFIS